MRIRKDNGMSHGLYPSLSAAFPRPEYGRMLQNASFYPNGIVSCAAVNVNKRGGKSLRTVQNYMLLTSEKSSCPSGHKLFHCGLKRRKKSYRAALFAAFYEADFFLICVGRTGALGQCDLRLAALCHTLPDLFKSIKFHILHRPILCCGLKSCA